MFRTTVMSVCVAVLTAAGSVAWAQKAVGPDKGEKTVGHEKAAAEAVCPITGEKIDKESFIDTDAGRVYFCCDKCIKKYKAHADKYAEKVFDQQEIMGPPRVQVTCPVSGKPVDPSISLDYQGKTIQFCCKKCPRKFKEDSAGYMAKYYKSFTTQTQCPVSGEDINPASFVSLSKDEKVFMCCDKCLKKFDANRSKYGAKLASFYLCPMAQCKDVGGLKASDCPKCGMHRKQIGKGRIVKAADHDKGHEDHDHAGHGH